MEDISLQFRIDVLDEQQGMIQDSAIAFIKEDEALAKVRACRFSQPGYDDETWHRMAEMGWLGFLIPDEYGGMGLGFGELHTVLIQLGKGLVPAPFSQSAVLAARVLVQSSAEGIKKKKLPELVSGVWKPALAWQEERGCVESKSTNVVFSAGKLNGRKILVPDAGGVDEFIVSAATDTGTALYLVDCNADGLSIEYEQRVDGGFYAQLNFNDVEVSECLAEQKDAQRILDDALDECRVAASAELLGVMTRALEISVAYLSQRIQFDRPIGSFQALQHKTVDLFILSEISRSVVLQTVALFDSNVDREQRSRAAAQVKARCSDAALRITKDAIQLHGGTGYTDEANIGLYFKKAMFLSSWLGNAVALRKRYAELTLSSRNDINE